MQRKTLSLAGLAMALIALAVPAAAQAEGPFWWEDHGGKEIFLEEPKEAGPQPELTFTFKGGLTVGPCTWGPKTLWAGLLFNTPEVGEGKIYEGGFEGACATSIPGCTVTVTPEFNWLLKLRKVGGKPLVDLTGVKLKFVPGAGCGGLQPATAEGTLTGEFDNKESRIVFNKAGDLTAGGQAVEVDGEIRFGTSMTVK